MAILLGELDISRLTNLIVGEGIEATKRFSGVVLSFLEEKQPTNRIAGLIRKNVIADLKLGEEGNSARKSVSSLATAVPGLTKSEFVAEILRRSELAIEEVDEVWKRSTLLSEQVSVEFAFRVLSDLVVQEEQTWDKQEALQLKAFCERICIEEVTDICLLREHWDRIRGKLDEWHDFRRVSDLLSSKMAELSVRFVLGKLVVLYANEDLRRLKLDSRFVKFELGEWSENIQKQALHGSVEGVREMFHSASWKVRIERIWYHGNRRRMVVQGAHGAGKTTLLQWIAHEWSRGKLWRSQFEAVVFLNLAQVRPDAKTLMDVLMSGVFNEDKLMEGVARDFLLWTEEHPVLWLFDEWDERVVEQGSIWWKIQNAESLFEGRVEYLMAVSRQETGEKMMQRDSLLLVEGFTDAGIWRFARHCVGEWDVFDAAITLLLCVKQVYGQRFDRYLRKLLVEALLKLQVEEGEQMLVIRKLFMENDWLKSSCCSPLILKFVCLVAPQLSRLERVNRTAFYKMVVDHFAGTEERKVLSEIAWKGDAIAQEFSGCGLVKSVGGGKFAWVHGLIQEYLAAEHLCSDQFGGNLTEELKRCLTLNHRKALFAFVCGIGGKAVECGMEWVRQIYAEEETWIWAFEEGGAEVEDLVASICTGEDILRAAAKEGCARFVRFLIAQNVSLNKRSVEIGRTALMEACGMGHLKIVESLIEAGADMSMQDDCGWSAAVFAVEGTHFEVLKCLIENGADVNSRKRNGWSLLVSAAQTGNLDAVKFLLQQGADVNAIDEEGWTALLIAAEEGHLDVAKCLIEYGANVNHLASAQDGWNAVCLASEHGFLELAQVLLERGADVNAALADGTTALMFAAREGHAKVLQWLISNGANVNSRNERGSTAILLASLHGLWQIVACLILHGAQVNAANATGATALMVASQSGHLSVVNCLIEHADVNATEEDGWTALCFAAQIGHLKIVKRLIEHGANVMAVIKGGGCAIMIASQNGHVNIVSELIENGADVNATDDEGCSSLIFGVERSCFSVVACLIDHGANVNAANKNGATALFFASQEGHLELVEYLIDHGAEVDASKDNGWTALFRASLFGCLEIIKCLVEHGANVNAVDIDGWTCLLVACDKGHVEVVKYLMEHGATIHAFENHGWTALMIACEAGMLEIVEALIERGANVNTANRIGETAVLMAVWEGRLDLVKCLIEHGSNVNAADKKGRTALLAASQKGHLDVVNCLIEHGANVNASNKKGKTALLAASQKGHLDVVNCLIEHGANVNASNKKGKTALLAASQKGRLDVVMCLIEMGANVNAADKKGKTAVLAAAAKGHWVVVKVLNDSGAVLSSPKFCGISGSGCNSK